MIDRRKAIARQLAISATLLAVIAALSLVSADCRTSQNPSSPGIEETLYQQAAQRFNSGDYDGCIKIVEARQVAKENQKPGARDADCLVLKARSLLATDRTDDALDCLKMAIHLYEISKANPRSIAITRIMLARHLKKSWRLESALELLRNTIIDRQQDPDLACDYYKILGHICLTCLDYEGAEHAFDQAITFVDKQGSDSELARLRLDLAHAQILKGRNVRASMNLDKAELLLRGSRRTASLPKLRYLRALIHLNQGEYESAVSQLRKNRTIVESRMPLKLPVSNAALGIAYYRLGNKKEARELLSPLVDICSLRHRNSVYAYSPRPPAGFSDAFSSNHPAGGSLTDQMRCSKPIVLQGSTSGFMVPPPPVQNGSTDEIAGVDQIEPPNETLLPLLVDDFCSGLPPYLLNRAIQALSAIALDDLRSLEAFPDPVKSNPFLSNDALIFSKLVNLEENMLNVYGARRFHSYRRALCDALEYSLRSRASPSDSASFATRLESVAIKDERCLYLIAWHQLTRSNFTDSASALERVIGSRSTANQVKGGLLRNKKQPTASGNEINVLPHALYLQGYLNMKRGNFKKARDCFLKVQSLLSGPITHKHARLLSYLDFCCNHCLDQQGCINATEAYLLCASPADGAERAELTNSLITRNLRAKDFSRAIELANKNLSMLAEQRDKHSQSLYSLQGLCHYLKGLALDGAQQPMAAEKEFVSAYRCYKQAGWKEAHRNDFLFQLAMVVESRRKARKSGSTSKRIERLWHMPPIISTDEVAVFIDWKKFYCPGSTPEAKKLLAGCLDRWSKAMSGLLKFSTTEDLKKADIVVSFANPGDLDDKLGETYKPPTHSLMEDRERIARQRSVNICPSSQLSCIDRHASPHSRIVTRQLSTYESKTLELTFMHEIGHAIGMRHSHSPRDLMYFHHVMQDLSDQDIKEARRLYKRKARPCKPEKSGKDRKTRIIIGEKHRRGVDQTLKGTEETL